MSENRKDPGKDKKNPKGLEQQDDKLDIGNNMSVGSENGSEVSDFDLEMDYPETEEREYQGDRDEGDDAGSDDNGVNPLPGEIDPGKRALNHNVENADEDALNPYPDELRPDYERTSSMWMVSGQNREI